MYREGKAVIKYTKKSFLNPDAMMSRDISVAFASVFAKKDSKVIDTTSATGIRGIRYYLETPSKDITMLEMNDDVLESLKKNVKYNRVKAKIMGDSIQKFANSTSDKFDIIDLDPFGGATPYIYDLMKISKDGTYLMITVTDTAVLCGADYKACIRLYDARPMHNEICHEVGMRILIGYVAKVAAQFNFGIEVLASFSYLHYMRIFVKIKHGSTSALDSVKKLGYVHCCTKCLYRHTEKSTFPAMHKCEMCGAQLETAGKVWLGSLQDIHAVSAVVREMDGKQTYNSKSIEFMKGISQEIDMPLYYEIPKITRKMGIGSVSTNALILGLRSHGFLASRTHISRYGIKTDANIKQIKSAILECMPKDRPS